MNIKQLEKCMEVYHQFYELHKVHQDIQKQEWDDLNNYNDLDGSKDILQERLSHIVELRDRVTENELKIKDLEKYTADEISILPARIQEQMQRDVSNLKYDQNKFVSALVDAKSNLETRLAQWNDFESSLDKILSSLNDAEAVLKGFSLKTTVDEKQEQLDKYQSIFTSLSVIEKQIEEMSDNLNELVQNSGDTRVTVNIQQITSRFQSIHLAAKEILKKCEQAFTDHKFYNEKYRQCADWISAALAK